MDRIRAILKAGQSGSGEQGAKDLVQKVKDVCGAVHGEDLERCRTMGRLGAEWLWKKRGQGKKGLKLVTVCNTGSLATSVSWLLHWVWIHKLTEGIWNGFGSHYCCFRSRSAGSGVLRSNCALSPGLKTDLARVDHIADTQHYDLCVFVKWSEG